MATFDQEFTLLRRRLMRQVRMLLSDRNTAEDLVQDTLLTVLEHRSGWRGEASLATWAVGILKHKVADWHRKHHHATTSLDDDSEDAQCANRVRALCAQCDHLGRCIPGASEPERALERGELAVAIDHCVARLPPQSAEVFMLHECLGLETEEISARLSISRDNCRTLLHRARINLRACLASTRSTLN